MKFTETKLKGAFLIDFEKREDNRGFFARAFCKKEFSEQGLETDLVQANCSYNFEKGTLRGMHRQIDPYQEVKIVRCTRGTIWDCIIDLRKDSPTYKQWVGVELSQDNHRTLYVPKDFGHGYLTLTDNSEVTYLVTEYYQPGAETGLRWDDNAFNIQWPQQINLELMTEKDRNWPDYI